MKKNRIQKITRVSYVRIAEIVIGLIVSTLALLMFLKLASNISELQSWDNTVSHYFYSWRSPFLTNLMVFFSYLGQELLYVFLLVLLLILFTLKKWRDIVILVTIASSGAVVNIVIKELISRDRPTIDPLFQEIFHSFPSFHAMNSFIFYSICVYFVYKYTRNRIYTLFSFLVGLIFVVCVGISRIYLGVHYPTDIIAGYLVGLVWVTTVLVIDRFVSISRRQ
jgi:undecaprenyl-diphosphatase